MDKVVGVDGGLGVAMVWCGVYDTLMTDMKYCVTSFSSLAIWCL